MHAAATAGATGVAAIGLLIALASPTDEPPAAPPTPTAVVFDDPVPGHLYGTFQSHRPAFAAAGGRLFRVLLTDFVQGGGHEATVEARLERLDADSWTLVWSDIGNFTAPCLTASDGVVWAAVAGLSTGSLTVVAVGDPGEPEVYAAPFQFPTAAKINCELAGGKLLILGQYGHMAIFDLAVRTFDPIVAAFAQRGDDGFATQYPHVAQNGDKLFLGHNRVPGGGVWFFVDLVGYVVDSLDEVAQATPRQLIPEQILGRSIWIADAFMAADRLYVAGVANDFDDPSDHFIGRGPNPGFFLSCDLELRCEAQETGVSRDYGGNFIANDGRLQFLTMDWDRFQLWTLDEETGRFALTWTAGHDVACPYSPNFSEPLDGVVYGQMIDAMTLCGPRADIADDMHESFEIRFDGATDDAARILTAARR